MELHPPRLLLREWRPDDPNDVRVAFEIYRRIEVARWLGARPQPWPSLEVAHERLARWTVLGSDLPGYGMWAIVPEATGQPVGTVLLAPLPDAEGRRTEDIEIGWHLHPDHWGNGYATEAARAVLEHGFGTLGLDRVNAVAHPGNEPSLAVMTRLGMTRQGSTDRWYGTTFDWWLIEADRPRPTGG